MVFNTTDEVKKWFRSIPLAKKEMELKIRFYEGLIADLARPYLKPESGRYTVDPAFYRAQIEKAKERYDDMLKDVDRLLELLSGEERAVLTAKYLNRVSWDAMEFHVYYSRRQAYRVHDRALARLVGQTAGGGAL